MLQLDASQTNSAVQTRCAIMENASTRVSLETLVLPMRNAMALNIVRHAGVEPATRVTRLSAALALSVVWTQIVPKTELVSTNIV